MVQTKFFVRLLNINSIENEIEKVLILMSIHFLIKSHCFWKN